jgi:methylated-DNA-[protein]-cysteine S-methyltransferase
MLLSDDVLPEPEILYRSLYDSPLGMYTIVTSNKGLVSVASPVTTPNRLERLERHRVDYRDGGEFYGAIANELDAYFKGKLTAFSIPLDLRGTQFQLRVWNELCRIPYGEISTYGWIAAATGNAVAARAVGHAIGSNPVAIIVPCHRVIGADGSLTGYASGLERKRYLLNLEAKISGKNEVW